MEDIRKIFKCWPDIGIILTEHDMTMIKNIADRVVVINYGQKIGEGSFVRAHFFVREKHELEARMDKV